MYEISTHMLPKRACGCFYVQDLTRHRQGHSLRAAITSQSKLIYSNSILLNIV